MAQASCLLSFPPVHRLLRLLDPSSLLQAWSSSLGISVPYLERQKICGESRLSPKHQTMRTKCRCVVSRSVFCIPAHVRRWLAPSGFGDLSVEDYHTFLPKLTIHFTVRRICDTRAKLLNPVQRAMTSPTSTQPTNLFLPRPSNL